MKWWWRCLSTTRGMPLRGCSFPSLSPFISSLCQQQSTGEVWPLNLCGWRRCTERIGTSVCCEVVQALALHLCGYNTPSAPSLGQSCCSIGHKTLNMDRKSVSLSTVTIEGGGDMTLLFYMLAGRGGREIPSEDKNGNWNTDAKTIIYFIVEGGGGMIQSTTDS